MFNKLLVILLAVLLGAGGVFAIMDRNTGEQMPQVQNAVAGIEVGARAIVPVEWDWIEVQYDLNGNFPLEAGSMCGIKFGGIVEVSEVLSEEYLLVEYIAPDLQLPTECPNGVQFQLENEIFMSMSADYYAAIEEFRLEQELVADLLAQNYYSTPVDAGDWQWVDMVNLSPLVQEFSNGKFIIGYGDTCGIGRQYDDKGNVIFDGGVIRSRGETAGRVLYEYTTDGEPSNTSCPSGVLFFGS